MPGIKGEEGADFSKSIYTQYVIDATKARREWEYESE
jgi:hypothetical protein